MHEKYKRVTLGQARARAVQILFDAERERIRLAEIAAAEYGALWEPRFRQYEKDGEE